MLPLIDNTKWKNKCRVENQNECKKLIFDEGEFIFSAKLVFKKRKEHGKSLIFSDHTRLTFQGPPAIEVVTPACMAAILTGGMEAAVEERVTAPARDTAECITTTSTIMTRQAQPYKYCPAFPVEGKETWSAHLHQFEPTISGGRSFEIRIFP